MDNETLERVERAREKAIANTEKSKQRQVESFMSMFDTEMEAVVKRKRNHAQAVVQNFLINLEYGLDWDKAYNNAECSLMDLIYGKSTLG